MHMQTSDSEKGQTMRRRWGRCNVREVCIWYYRVVLLIKHSNAQRKRRTDL
jgi:hypothetical protein